jgi:plastocyanin
MLAALAPSHAAANTVVAGPGGAITGYATPQVVVVTAGGDATFVNADAAAPHDVRSVRNKSNGQPLFKSTVIDAGETAPIVGTGSLAAGDYDFICTLHANMTGTITVAA